MTRDFHRPLTPKKLSQLAESVTQASALEPGLTMVVGPYSELVHLVYATMVKELVQGSSRLPIPLPECSSTSGKNLFGAAHLAAAPLCTLTAFIA